MHKLRSLLWSSCAALSCFLLISITNAVGQDVVEAPQPSSQTPSEPMIQGDLVQEAEPESVAEPLVSLDCKIAEANSKLFAKLKETANESYIFSTEINNCRFSEDLTGSLKLTAELLLRFNRAAEFKECATFTLGFLIASRVEDSKIAWSGGKRLVNDVLMENIEGLTQNIENFSIHTYTNANPVGYDELFIQDYEPSVPDVFWGEAVLFSEVSGGQLHSQIEMLKQISMEAKSKDKIEVLLQIEILEAAGVCFSRPPTVDEEMAALRDPKVALEFGKQESD